MTNSFTVEAAEKLAYKNVEEAARLLEIEPSKFIDEAIRFDIWIYIEVPVGAPLAATYINTSRRALDAFKHDDFGALETEVGIFTGETINNFGPTFQLRVGPEVLRKIKKSGVSWQQRFWDFRRSAPAPEFHSNFTQVENEALWREGPYEITACFVAPVILLGDKYLPDFYVIKRSHLLVSGPDLAKWMGYSRYDKSGKYPVFPRDRFNRFKRPANGSPRMQVQEEQNRKVVFDEAWAQNVINLVDELLNLLYSKKAASTSGLSVDRGFGLQELVRVYCDFWVRFPKGQGNFDNFDDCLKRRPFFSEMKISENYKRKLFHTIIKKSVFAQGDEKRLGVHLARNKIMKELEGERVSEGLLAIIGVAADYISKESPVSASVFDQSLRRLGIAENNMPVIRKILALHDSKTGPKPARVSSHFLVE